MYIYHALNSLVWKALKFVPAWGHYILTISVTDQLVMRHTSASHTAVSLATIAPLSSDLIVSAQKCEWFTKMYVKIKL